MNLGEPLVEMVMAPLRDALTKEILALPIPGLIPQLPESAGDNITIEHKKVKTRG